MANIPTTRSRIDAIYSSSNAATVRIQGVRKLSMHTGYIQNSNETEYVRYIQ